MLVVPAMGVTQAYYAPFAEWLAAQGFLVATFDYRGIGQSRHGRLRRLKVDLLDWARQDCAAMIDAVTPAHRRQSRLYWVGHSLGGQILPFVPNRERVSRVVTVATGSGYWRENTAVTATHVLVAVVRRGAACRCACSAIFPASACARSATCRAA